MNMSIEQYPAVKAAWKHVVPLTACLNTTRPYPEDIVYPNFSDYIEGNVVASGLPDASMGISSTAQVSAQGTLSGMGGSFATASDGSGNRQASPVHTAPPTGSSTKPAFPTTISKQQSHKSSGACGTSSISVFPLVLVAVATVMGSLLACF